MQGNLRSSSFSIFCAQKNCLSAEDIRVGETDSHNYIWLEEVDIPHFQQFLAPPNPQMLRPQTLRLEIVANRPTNSNFHMGIGSDTAPSPVSPVEPNHAIYPYLSKRKVVVYRQNVNSQHEREVLDTLENLVSKVDRLANPQHTKHEDFEKACADILGFPITAFLSPGGKQAGIIVSDYDTIPIEAMGEGVPNLLGLIVNLCMARNKIFLIEEIENDVPGRTPLTGGKRSPMA